MQRTWQIWLAFSFCLAVVLAALGWISLAALRLDRADAVAASRADLEEDARLALWRIDSTLATIIAQENARPYFFFPAAAADVPWSEEGLPSAGIGTSAGLERTPHLWLHFQFAPDGELTSPQVPPDAGHASAPISMAPSESLDAATERLNLLAALLDRDRLLALLPAAEPLPEEDNSVPAPELVAQKDQASRQSSAGQLARNAIEYQARAQSYKQMAVDNALLQNAAAVPHRDVQVGLMQPFWIGDELVLARRLTLGREAYVQGCWVNWPALRESLLESVRDLLPSAQIEPVRTAQGVDQARMLATLPAELVPGLPLTPPDELTPIELSLFIAWACVLLAAIAVGLLLWGVVQLSERRGAFVSAVTHELRTPLTTFRMYAEMLADGMVPEPDRRQHYLNTLRTEADRLHHLVENVLAYARLERGNSHGRLESVTVSDLLNQVNGRLHDRAQIADVRLEVDAAAPILAAEVRTDSRIVEQILFNLVDNACKYGAGTEPVIRVTAEQEGRQVLLRVRDHGPGIDRPQRRRLFQPFSKSAAEAAHSAPGVGLGLALSRRLARGIGGDLSLAKPGNGHSGAEFVLSLPRA